MVADTKTHKTNSGIAEMFTGSASPLAIVGAGLFWLWVDSAVFTSTLCDTSNSQGGYAWPFIVATLVSVLMLITMTLRQPFGSPFDARGTAWAITSGIMGTAGSFLSILSMSWGGLPLSLGGFILIGAAFGALNVLWGWICVVQGHSKALIHISAAWALALPFNLLFAVIPQFIASILVSLLPALSVVVLLVLRKQQNNPTLRIEPQKFTVSHILQDRATFLDFDGRLLALILVFCAVFGLMYAQTVWLAQPAQDSSLGIQVVGTRGLTALVFFVLALTVLRDKIKLLFRLCLCFVLAGLMVMIASIFAPTLNQLSEAIVAVGYCGFDILVWVMIAFHAYVNDNAPARNVSIAMGAEQLGIFVGMLLGSLALSGGIPQTPRMVLVMVASMLAMIVLVGYTEYGSRLWTLLLKTSLSSSEAFDAQNRLGDLAKKYGLTQRETEILAIFAEGRSMPYIAEKMYVSENTVKTHVRHIYTKCGVHNKQELLDLVEAYKRQS